MLKNLMEKQLDFNAPLMSVRRFASTSGSSEVVDTKKTKTIEKSCSVKRYLPLYKSELKSGPIRNAGAVPFQWEQTPGHPKDGDGSRPRLKALDRPPVAPKLPPGRILEAKQEERESEETSKVIRSQIDNVTKLESSKGVIKEEEVDSPLAGCDDDEDDDDEAFSDALDTLSHAESCFMNCSLNSGVTGLTRPDSKLSGSFSMDLEGRSFMMDRFLPAAKAMTSEMPQYVSRKQPVAHKPASPVKRVDGDRRGQTLPFQYRPNFVPQYARDKEDEDSDEEDEDCGQTGDLSMKACGFLPRFCLRNSLCLLNPVLGMKVKRRVPLSPMRGNNSQIKSTHGGSLSEAGDEETWEAVYKHKLLSGLQSHGAFIDGSNKPASESNQLTIWTDTRTPDGSSPYKQSTVGGISPYRNETPQSSFHEGTGFLGVPKQGKNCKADGLEFTNKGRSNLRELLSHHNHEQGSGLSSPAVEKTLYVDSVHTKSISPDTKEPEIPVESQAMDDINQPNILKERGMLEPKISDVIESDPPPSSGRSNLGGHREDIKGICHNDGSDWESKSLVLADGKLDLNGPQSLKDEGLGNTYPSSLQSLLPPPLPKSPSESWLWRTLPSVTSKNPFSRSYQSKKQLVKESSVDPKWENIVKTSNVHHGHLLFSEELITPASQQSESSKI